MTSKLYMIEKVAALATILGRRVTYTAVQTGLTRLQANTLDSVVRDGGTVIECVGDEWQFALEGKMNGYLPNNQK